MRKIVLRSLTVLTLSGLALSLSAWAVATYARQSGGQQATRNEGPKRKTLRDIARERDVESDAPEGELGQEYNNLGLLARHAEAIVIGRVSDEVSSFDGDDEIYTSYRLDVQRVLKATKLNAAPGVGQEPPAPLLTPLKVVRRGGIVQVNGHRVSQKLRGADSLKAGKNVLLFLWWSPALKAYTLAGGVSGVFLIDGDQRLTPLGSTAGMLKHSGSGLQNVIDEILANQ